MNKVSTPTVLRTSPPNLGGENKLLLGVRDGFGEALVELGEKDSRVVVLTADVGESIRTKEFARRFPDRFIQCGVAEQNMMGIAAGLAAAGKIPFVTSFAVFSPGRNWDQLRISVCYSNLPVKVIGGHVGILSGHLGASHQALEDIAITRVLPNMTVVAPADYYEAKKATLAMVNINGPVYMRMPREKTEVLTEKDTPFEIGKTYEIKNQNANSKNTNKKEKILIVGCGAILGECLKAQEKLAKENILTEVINCHTIKPLDREFLLVAVSGAIGVVTVEDHQIHGGLGSAIAELLVVNRQASIVEMVGMKDTFGESGKPEELAQKYGLTDYDVEEGVKRILSRIQ